MKKPILKKIFGPPGTGKTTHLLSIVELLLESNVPPAQIAFTTFTRAGANEALERACVKFNKSSDDFPFFKTLHALAYRYGSKKKVLGYDDFKHISEDLSLPLTFGQTSYDGSITSSYKGDHIMAIYQLARVKCIDLEQSYNEYRDAIGIDYGEVRRFAEYYEEYKRVMDRQDFTDMLEGFIQKDQPLDIDYLIIDEAQDIKPLEWEVLNIMMRPCKKIWIAGDDDQCIHTWAGSDPDYFMDLEGESIVLEQSYRVPEEVHFLAHNIIKKISKRQSKEYRPTSSVGAVNRLNSIGELNVGQGSWFMLARNKRMLLEYEEYCRRHGYLFTTPDKRSNSICEAVCIWERLINGGMISGAEAKLVYKHLKERDRVKVGSKKMLNAMVDDQEMLDIHQLQSTYGLVWHQSWDSAFLRLTQEEKDYLTKVEQTTGFEETPRIELNTIHGSKGKEADNVVMMLDMSYRTYDSFLHDPDNEHRVFYVGVTRTKQNLFLLSPKTDKHYEI